MKQFLDYDPITRITTYFEYDSLTDQTHIHYEQDATLDVEFSKHLAKDEEYTKKGIKNEMWHYAHIPDILLVKWMKEGVDINNAKALFKKVNESEYSLLRTTTKRHS